MSEVEDLVGKRKMKLMNVGNANIDLEMEKRWHE